MSIEITTDQSDPTGATSTTVDGRPCARVMFEARMEMREHEAIGKPYQFLHGRAVPYGEWTSLGMFMESHAPDSLKQSTTVGKGRALPLLLFHDHRSFPIGVSDSWIHSADGLDGVWRLNETAEAQRAGRAAEAGELTGLSIGFQPVQSKWDMLAWEDWDPDLGPEHMDHVTRLESKLLEVSMTPTPAFDGAQVSAVRSLPSPTAARPMTWTHDAQVMLRASHVGARPEPEADRWREIVDGLRSPQR